MRTPHGLAAALLGSAAFAASQSWNFDRSAQGKVASGWTNASGAWRVVADRTAPSKPNVLAQVSSSHSGSYFNVTVANEPRLTDVTIRVRARVVAGREDQGGGPVWRYRDLRNYYVARYNPLEENYRVYRVVSGRRIQLGSADLKAPSGTWHEMRVTMQGQRIQCFFDGRKYLDVRDDTFAGAGRVGLWTKADARTQFDDFAVQGQ
jgi:hypothetical protein